MHAHTEEEEEEDDVTPTLFISFNPVTEFGQKCLNPAPF